MQKEKVVVYSKATCSKSRKAILALNEAEIPFENIEYYDTPVSAEKLLELARKMGVKVEDLIRKKENIYQSLDLRSKNFSERDLAEVMSENPDLIERPIIEMGEMAVIARDPEKVRDIIKKYKSF